MAALRIFRVGDRVSLVVFFLFLKKVFWGKLCEFCANCAFCGYLGVNFRYLQFMVFAISDRLCVGYFNS